MPDFSCVKKKHSVYKKITQNVFIVNRKGDEKMGKPLASRMCEAAPKYLGTAYSEMDCQAFVEKCMSDAGVSMNLAGSNTWYRNMTWVGTPEECRKKFGTIPKGAFLYILEHDGGEPKKYQGDGIGNVSHIGLYTGMTVDEMVMPVANLIEDKTERNAFVKKVYFGNGAMHSSSSRKCVCTSYFGGKTISGGGWNRIGLWNAFSYGEAIDAILNGNKAIEEKTETGGDGMTATVYTADGKTVKMRNRPSTNSSLYWDIPSGTIVTVTGESDGEWTAIRYGGRDGYMMSKFLVHGTIIPGEDSTPANDQVPVSREWLKTVRDEIDRLLGAVG